MEQVHLPVRQLVEFLLQTGSIDSRFSGFDRAAEGARIHRRLQKAAGAGYEAEVYLKQEYSAAGVDYLIDGRADGIFTADGLVTVDEIKTVTIPSEQITQDMKPVHWAQGQVYAAIYAAQHSLAEMAVRLTYFQVDEEKIIRFTRRFTAAELDSFVQALLAEYAPWAKRAAAWAGARAASLQALPFPFDQYRGGQRAMAAAAYRTFRDGGRLLCQAPTGIGKTISTLYPAVKALGEGYTEKLFYLTAKTITRQATMDACEKMAAQGLRLRTIVLTAKDKICFCRDADGNRNGECNPDGCPYAKGHFSRVNDALYDLLGRCDLYSRAAVEACAREHRVCPFELQLDATLWCDCIVGDYN